MPEEIKNSTSFMALPPNLKHNPRARAGFGTAGVVLLICTIVANGIAASGLLPNFWMRLAACFAMIGSGLATLFAYWATPPTRTPRRPSTPKPNPTA